MNPRIVGRLLVTAAFAAAIVVSDPGGAGNIVAPTSVASGAATGSNAIIIGDASGTVQDLRVLARQHHGH
jgi:hypothetical protein